MRRSAIPRVSKPGELAARDVSEHDELRGRQLRRQRHQTARLVHHALVRVVARHQHRGDRAAGSGDGGVAARRRAGRAVRAGNEHLAVAHAACRRDVSTSRRGRSNRSSNSIRLTGATPLWRLRGRVHDEHPQLPRRRQQRHHALQLVLRQDGVGRGAVHVVPDVHQHQRGLHRRQRDRLVHVGVVRLRVERVGDLGQREPARADRGHCARCERRQAQRRQQE